MEAVNPVRFTLGRQSSLAPKRKMEGLSVEEREGEEGEGIDPRVRLMYLANERDLEGIRELLDVGTDVNFWDIDARTALHITASQGFTGGDGGCVYKL